MHLWSDPPHGHMKNSNERYLVTLLLILTGFLFESLTLMLWIAEELLSLPDFSHTCQLSLKGMHDEGNYTCRLREILRMNDTRTFPTLKSQATSWRECFFRSTSSPESSRSFNDFHDVPFGGVMKTCSVVGPFSLIRARISWEKESEVSCHLSCSREQYLLVRNRPMVCTGAMQRRAWTRMTSNWFCASIFSCTHPTLMLTLNIRQHFFFYQVILWKARNELCETYQDCLGPLSFLADWSQLLAKQFSSIKSLASALFVMVGPRVPVWTGCPRRSMIFRSFLCI